MLSPQKSANQQVFDLVGLNGLLLYSDHTGKRDMVTYNAFKAMPVEYLVQLNAGDHVWLHDVPYIQEGCEKTMGFKLLQVESVAIQDGHLRLLRMLSPAEREVSFFSLGGTLSGSKPSTKPVSITSPIEGFHVYTIPLDRKSFIFALERPELVLRSLNDPSSVTKAQKPLE